MRKASHVTSGAIKTAEGDADANAAYTVRIHCEDGEVPFWAEVDEHPELTAFGRELGELLENVAEGINSLE